jgi:hypothetical protein
MYYKELTVLLLMILTSEISTSYYVDIYDKMRQQIHYIKEQQCLRIIGKQCPEENDSLEIQK